jgi:uncharacterized protein (DUF736 family)
MKKMLITIMILLSSLTHAAGFGGSWKHHYINVENISIRISFIESRVAPTYGLHYGGRVASKIHIDAWGDLDHKSLDYYMVNLSKGEIINEFEGTLIKESINHQYDALTVRDRFSSSVDYIWLEGNHQNEQELSIKVDGREFKFRLEL